MKSFNVTITEKLQITVEVEANYLHEAEHLAKKNWENGDYLIDAEHFKGVTFRAENPKRSRGYDR